MLDACCSAPLRCCSARVVSIFFRYDFLIIFFEEAKMQKKTKNYLLIIFSAEIFNFLGRMFKSNPNKSRPTLSIFIFWFEKF